MSNAFVPTFLYIKRHRDTGKLYLGKTIKKNPEKYNGSGVHWKKHINAHGIKKIDTIWFCLFTEQDELSKFALMCSEQWNIVLSKDWLNIIPENGLGTPPGIKFSEDHKYNIHLSKAGTHVGEGNPFFGKSHSAESLKKMSDSQTGENHSQFGKSPSKKHRASISKSNSGKVRTPEMNLLNSERNTGIISAFDLIQKKNVRVTKSEFELQKETRYVGITSRRAKES